MHRNLRRAAKLIISVLIAFVLGSLVAFWFVRFRAIAMSAPPQIQLKDGSLILSFQDHPPWAHTHVVNVEVDMNRNKIRICEYYMVWNPFSKSVQNTHSVILDRLPENDFEVMYFASDGFKSLGTLVVRKGKTSEWKGQITGH